MQKRYFFVAGGVIIALIALSALLSGGQPTASAQGRTTTEVVRTSFDETIESSGTIAAAERLTLGFGTTGRVTEVLVEVGDTVAAGDVLARLDTTDLENQLARQEQALAIQQASYNQLTAQPSVREVTQSEASVASAQAQVVQAQANLDASGLNLTINCASVESAQIALENAQEAYDEYVNDGYAQDATFIPDPDSQSGSQLRTAQSSYDVAVAQCERTTPASQLEASLVSAQASLTQAQAALDDLLAGPTADELASAEAQLAQARLQLENAQAALEDAVIRAPLDGVIATVNIRSGQWVNAMGSAFELVDVSQMHIDVAVDELDIVQVEVEQPAVVLPEALDGVALDGVVSRIAPVASQDGNLVTYSVRVDIEDADSHPIRVGMTTDVEIIVSGTGEVLAVETDAVQRQGTAEYVEVVNADGTLTRVNITTGQSFDGMTVINGDVVAGQVVAIPERATSTGGGLPFGGN